jgi:FixJ family two-component response regulator
LVLTDIVMAGMSGWELGEKLKSVRPDQRVLFMSGYSDEVLADHGVVESSIPLVLKPFTSADLARSVRRMLDGPPLP